VLRFPNVLSQYHSWHKSDELEKIGKSTKLQVPEDEQVSTVQMLPSSQLLVNVHDPVVLLQLSVVQSSPSSHKMGCGTHAAAVSLQTAGAHKLPELHVVRLNEHLPLLGLHVVTLQKLDGHVGSLSHSAVPLLATVQKSFVHKLPSSQTFFLLAQEPVATSQ